MFRASLCPSSGEQRTRYCIWCIVLVLLDVVGSGCGALRCRMRALQIEVYAFFYLIEQHSKFLLHTLQVLYMCTLCASTNISTIIDFVPHVSGDGFIGGSDSYPQFRDTHAPYLLKLCIPPSNGIVRWWLFPEFGAESPLDNCTPTIILNNPV